MHLNACFFLFMCGCVCTSESKEERVTEGVNNNHKRQIPDKFLIQEPIATQVYLQNIKRF